MVPQRFVVADGVSSDPSVAEVFVVRVRAEYGVEAHVDGVPQADFHVDGVQSDFGVQAEFHVDGVQTLSVRMLVFCINAKLCEIFQKYYI